MISLVLRQEQKSEADPLVLLYNKTESRNAHGRMCQEVETKEDDLESQSSSIPGKLWSQIGTKISGCSQAFGNYSK